MSLDELIRSATSRAGVVRVSNILNSLLWASATAIPICFWFSYLFLADPLLHYGLAGLGSLPIILMIVSYTYFMFRQPDRLQSEEFILSQQEIRIIERKDGPPILREIDKPVEPSRLSNLERKTESRS